VRDQRSASGRVPAPGAATDAARIALVHDWLTGMRGGEKVLEALLGVFPHADIHTLVHVRGRVSPAIERRRVVPSPVSRLPGVGRYYRHLLPWFPVAVEWFDLDGYDLVISSSHCAVKSVVVPGRARHLCYCHTPMRYVWDRYYTSTRDQNTLALTWNHALSPRLIHTAKLTRYFTATHKDVAGKRWDEYDLGDSLLVVRPDPYFRVDAEGDATDYRDRYSRTWSLDSDWIWRWRKHDIKWGWRGQYETVQYFSVNASSVSSARPLGKEYDLFNVTPNTGALYLQDAIEQEGLIAKFGVRYDYWFPGEQVERLYREQSSLIASEETEREWLNDTHPLFGHRFKGHLSPRIEVSHPITDRDNLFFNYGHFSQRPNYFYVYAKSGTQSAEEFPRIGNPNLNPEISVQYELGAQHTFRQDMALKVSLYYKDIYDYPTSTTIQLGESGTTRSSYFVYYNLDYARSRGLEVEWRRRGGSRASWMASYTYSVTKGKGSDPNDLALIRASGGDARDTELDEVYMWWNRPHKLTLSYDYRIARGDHGARPLGFSLPDDLSLNLYYLLQSGYAYSPVDSFGSPTGPEFSENGPYEQTLNGTLRKGFSLAGRRFEATLQGWNLTDHRTVQGIDRVTGELPQIGEGSLANSTASTDWLHGLVSNPAYRSAPRSVRLGLGVEL